MMYFPVPLELFKLWTAGSVSPKVSIIQKSSLSYLLGEQLEQIKLVWQHSAQFHAYSAKCSKQKSVLDVISLFNARVWTYWSKTKLLKFTLNWTFLIQQYSYSETSDFLFLWGSKRCFSKYLRKFRFLIKEVVKKINGRLMRWKKSAISFFAVVFHFYFTVTAQLRLTFRYIIYNLLV